jgi:hypothetical protein
MATRAKAPKQKPPAAVPAGVNALMSRAQVLTALGGISARQLAYMIARDEFPGPDQSIGRCPRWTIETFNAWVSERSHARRP